jgi:hypothetical protein
MWHPLGDRMIHKSMSCQSACAGKALGNQPDAVVASSALRAGMPGMQMAVIGQIDLRAGKSLLQSAAQFIERGTHHR